MKVKQMYTKTYSLDLVGVDSRVVEVETNISKGLSNFNIIGLADRAISEARERIICAIGSSGFKYLHQHTVVNLAPASVAKSGSHLDLAIAAGYLIASGQSAPLQPDDFLIGELSLAGEVKPVKNFRALLSGLPASCKRVFVPRENNATISSAQLVPVSNIRELAKVLAIGTASVGQPARASKKVKELDATYQELAEIEGNYQAKRALEIAAVGRHHLLFSGVAGAGKTMLARTLTGVLPQLSVAKRQEITRIYEIAGLLEHDANLSTTPLCRSPHSGTTLQGMVGGQANASVGEVTLAHEGVLLLDEAPLFSKSVLDGLRQPLDNRSVQISRSKVKVTLPANFQLVVTMNPCPCGNLGSSSKRCTCNTAQLLHYRQRLSRPVMDRIAIGVNILGYESVSKKKLHVKTSEQVRLEVTEARRYAADNRSQNVPNSQIDEYDISYSILYMDSGIRAYAKECMSRLGISWRRYQHTLRIALSVADFGSRRVKKEDIDEALSLQFPLISIGNYILDTPKSLIV